MIAGRTVLDLQRSNGLRNPGAITAPEEAVAQLADKNHAEEKHGRLNPRRNRCEPMRKLDTPIVKVSEQGGYSAGCRCGQNPYRVSAERAPREQTLPPTGFLRGFHQA